MQQPGWRHRRRVRYWSRRKVKLESLRFGAERPRLVYKLTPPPFMGEGLTQYC
jgi:hypothetical protein